MRRRESDVSCEFRGWWRWCKGDQQVAERGESSPTEVTKGLLRGVGDVAIETIQQGLPRGRDPISAAPASARRRRSPHWIVRPPAMRPAPERSGLPLRANRGSPLRRQVWALALLVITPREEYCQVRGGGQRRGGAFALAV